MRRDDGFWHRSRARETSEETNQRPLDESSRRSRRRRARGEAREPPLLLRHRSPHFQSQGVSSSSSSSKSVGAPMSKKLVVVVIVVHCCCCCCSLLLLLLLTFFKRESSDIKKTQNDSHFLDFCELFVFPSFLPSFLPSQKKLQIEAPLTHRHQSSTWPRYERREHSFHSRARFSRSLSRSRKKEGRARRTGGCGNVLRARTWCPRKKCGGRERKMFPHPFEKGRAKDGCEGRAFGWTTTWCWNDASGRVVILVARFWGHHPCHSRG